MAYEITIIVRFERMPDVRELTNVIEDAYDDAVVIETEEEAV